MKWEVGQLSASEVRARDKSINWLKIEAIKAPVTKTLQEARGYVVADYQDSLESEWIERLKKDYEVKINEKVFQSLIRK